MTTITKNPVIYAPVYIPYTPDCEYDLGEKLLSPEKIRYLSQTFKKYQIIDLQHEYSKRIAKGLKPIQRGKVVADFIAKKPMKLRGIDGAIREYPAGTWIIGIEITDKTAMKLYYQGKLGGVSATAKKRKDADFLMEYVSAKSIEQIPKRILLSDIQDPVIFTISLVRKPCVYGAKFCNKSCLILNEDKLEDNKMSMIDMIKEKINTALDDVDLEKSLAESQKSELEENINEEEEVEEVVVETKEEGNEEEVEEENEESQKSAYLTREEAQTMFKEGFNEMRGDIETFVDQTITESVTALQESQKEALGLVTRDEAQAIYKEEFNEFKTDLETSLKQRQEESIKQFSKTIENNTTQIVEKPVTKPQNKLFADRDANGCKVRH